VRYVRFLFLFFHKNVVGKGWGKVIHKVFFCRLFGKGGSKKVKVMLGKKKAGDVEVIEMK
jgi:hypothetical protein